METELNTREPRHGADTPGMRNPIICKRTTQMATNPQKRRNSETSPLPFEFEAGLQPKRRDIAPIPIKPNMSKVDAVCGNICLDGWIARVYLSPQNLLRWMVVPATS